MEKLYTVDGIHLGYGATAYFCVKAETHEEAIYKAKNKQIKLNKEKYYEDVLPCEVHFDDNGVSQNLVHLW